MRRLVTSRGSWRSLGYRNQSTPFQSQRATKPGEVSRRTSIQFSVTNRTGGLLAPIQIFAEHDINLVQLKSREGRDTDKGQGITMYCDFDGHVNQPHVQAALEKLKEYSDFLTVVNSHEIPYFPTRVEDLDLIDQEVLEAGEDLQDDPDAPHPGFHDQAYRQRRVSIVRNAFTYKHGDKIPRVPYEKEDIKCWGTVYKELMKLFPTHTCRQYQYNFPLLVENCGFREDNIPQLEDISNYLREQTGFQLRPIAGLLGARDFLAGLAFRTFFSTQYIRHHSKPLYTPEPDICHELMGHVPLFADPDFADFSQTIGLASLGASDEDVKKLATCYWFTVEFGMCRQEGQVRAYGAGLLSSFGELQYCMSEEPVYKYVRELRDFNPFEACQQEYPICLYQPVYYVAESFKDAKVKMEEFAASLQRPFKIEYNPYTSSVKMLTSNTEAYMRGEW